MFSEPCLWSSDRTTSGLLCSARDRTLFIILTTVWTNQVSTFIAVQYCDCSAIIWLQCCNMIQVVFGMVHFLIFFWCPLSSTVFPSLFRSFLPSHLFSLFISFVPSLPFPLFLYSPLYPSSSFPSLTLVHPLLRSPLSTDTVHDTQWLFPRDRVRGRGRAYPDENPPDSSPSFDGVQRVWKKSDPATTGICDPGSLVQTWFHTIYSTCADTVYYYDCYSAFCTSKWILNYSMHRSIR